MKKKILSIVLLACVLLNSLPVATFAEEAQPECSHVCDESCGFVAASEEVACDKDCKPAEEGGEVTHVEGCAYKAAVEGSPCTHKHNGECGVECAHNYVEGKCAVCGMAEPCAHTGGTATCEAQAVCDTCGEGYGELADHVYGEDGKCTCGAACTHNYAEGVCSVCGMAEPCAHTGGTATCEAQAICDTCGEGYGELADHVYGEDGKCTCGAACTHNYAEGVCSVCGMKEPEPKPVCNCGTDDASIHATTCAVYAAPEKPECHCVEKCLEANIWCDVCGIDYSLCGGTGKAGDYTAHTHCLSVHEGCTGHDAAVTWEPWDSTTSLPAYNGNYYLTADVILSERHKVRGTVNLCLNGHTITPSGSGFGAIEVAGNLSLTDCQGNGKITGFTNTAGKGGAVYSEGTFTMYGGIISGNTVINKYYNDGMGGGVYSSGTFTMHGGTISDNEASYFGGGVYIAPGKQFTMSGGTIENNKVTTTGNAQNYGGGGVYSDGTFTMSGGTIKNNKANTMGGGVCISNIPESTATSSFAMSGGEIIGNEAPNGGGVYIDSRKQFTMNGGTISGNTSTTSGGGVRVNGTFTMSNGTISGNNAGYGGGVYISPTSASFTMAGGKITGNTATTDGGGVYMYKGAEAFYLSGSPIISGNTGGNCYTYNDGTCFMTVTGALGENAKIGITTWDSMPSRPFCKPANSVDLSNYKNWFFSDRVDRAIAKNGDGSLYTTIVYDTYNLTFDSTQAKVTVRGFETKKAAQGDIVVIRPIVPEGATVASVTVASVTATGYTVADHGDGTYSFTMPDRAVTITVTFNSSTVNVTGVTLVKDTLDLAVGDSETLTAIVAPDNATNKNVSWTSSNTEVATVDETGKVTAVGAGTATITVKTEDGEFTDTRTVTVVEEYDVWVGGVQITSANKDNLIKAINDANNGSVASGGISYDPDSKTLTLDNFSCSSDAFGGVINIQDGDITIKLKGNNTLTGTGEYPYGIYTTRNLVICNGEDGAAQGQLTINTENYCINAYSGTLEINGVKVVATSTGGAGLSAESISLSGVTLSAIGGGDMYVIGESISVENSTVEAYCASGSPFSSTFKSAPTITGDYAVYAGENAGNADKVDAPTNETYTQSKYVRIEPANTVKKYTVTYKADGKVVKIVEVEHGKDATAPEIPAKTGYTAVWSAEGKNITADTVINAVYTINQYTITFNTDGGSAVAAIKQDYNTEVTAPDAPTKTGHTFAGWEPALPETMPAEDMTVKAQWTPYQLTFRFDANGGVGDTMENLVVSYGETKNLTANAYTKDGYSFAGWTTESDGSGDFYANQAEVQMNKEENATITLWAKWTKNQTPTVYYVVSFDANGGSSTMASVDVQANTVLTLPANGFKAPSGKTFKCWDVNGTEYAAGKDVIITADTTVKAVWKPLRTADLDYVPAAGDNFPIFLWTCLAFSSALALFFLFVLGKKYAKK